MNLQSDLVKATPILLDFREGDARAHVLREVFGDVQGCPHSNHSWDADHSWSHIHR